MSVSFEKESPSDRAEKFFTTYLKERRLVDGDRLPSTREIATAVGISEGTVRNVVRKWSGEGKLRSKRGSGTFIQAPAQGTKFPIRIATNAGVLDEAHFSGWIGSICMHAFQTSLKWGPKVSFTSLFSEDEYKEGVDKHEIADRCSQVDSVIITSGSVNADLILNCCRLYKKPYIFLNPWAENSTVNFVAPDHFHSFYETSRILKECGRTRFAALIFPTIERSASIRARMAGLVNGLGASLGHAASLHIVPCQSWHEKAGYDAIRKLEREGPLPDAILCAGDGLALGAVTALRELGVSTPGQVSVISGTGMEPGIASQSLTSLVLPTEEMGRRLVLTLVNMVETGTLETPGQILPVGIITGSSTTSRESELLKDAFQKRKAS